MPGRRAFALSSTSSIRVLRCMLVFVLIRDVGEWHRFLCLKLCALHSVRALKFGRLLRISSWHQGSHLATLVEGPGERHCTESDMRRHPHSPDVLQSTRLGLNRKLEPDGCGGPPSRPVSPKSYPRCPPHLEDAKTGQSAMLVTSIILIRSPTWFMY